MPGVTALGSGASRPQQQFSDAELSEIFQIDFAEIFGSPDVGVGKSSDYKGINLPKKKTDKDRAHQLQTQQKQLRNINQQIVQQRPQQQQVQQNAQHHANNTHHGHVAMSSSSSFSSSFASTSQNNVTKSSASNLFKSSSSSNILPPPPPLLPPTNQSNGSNNTYGLSKSSSSSKVMVLPALTSPVNLSAPAKGNKGKGPKTVETPSSADADMLIEELMKEAEVDPALREMSGIRKQPHATNISEKYPMVKRPYRTQQDLIIQDSSSNSNSDHNRFIGGGVSSSTYSPVVKKKQRSEVDNSGSSRGRQARGATKNTNSMLSARSMSADSRPKPVPDPKVAHFLRSPSTDNLTEAMHSEILTDRDHHSVKDLVRMMEKNTNAESGNAYVRKWGCDLISPEPRTRNVTYRREKKQSESEENQQEPKRGQQMKPAHNWTRDDFFQHRHKIDATDSNLPGHQAHFHQHNFDESYTQQQQQLQQSDNSNNFQMGAHVADLDDLLGRPPKHSDVQWPPPPTDVDMDPEHRESDIGQVLALQEEEERLRLQQKQAKSQQQQFLTPQTSVMSDDEGSYQALSVVFAESGVPPPRPPPPSSYEYSMSNHNTNRTRHQSSSNNFSNNNNFSNSTFKQHGNYSSTEADDLFRTIPTPSQGPIMLAAHDLHHELTQWSSEDNDIVAAAKQVALLMGRLSKLLTASAEADNTKRSKKELIAVAKAIAEAAEEVTRIAKELGGECTDKRMRTNIWQLCERVPTMAQQLKIVSTVKATLMGIRGNEEDQEATDVLIGNAQNLMETVKAIVTAAEAMSIKIRTDAGVAMQWVRKGPWYQY